MRRLLLALALLSVLAGCHGARTAPRAVVVEAEGVVAVTAGDALHTRRSALAQAQRAAIEKANGLAIASRTRLDRSVEVEQRILARAAGSITRCKVLSEYEQSGLHHTMIRAWVRQLSADDADSVPLPPPGDPKVVVMILDESPALVRSAIGVKSGLAAAGVSLTEGEPDVVIAVAVETRALDSSDLGGLASARAHVSSKAVDLRTKTVLGLVERDASAVDLTAAGATGKAAQAAGTAAGRELAAVLNRTLAGR